jgi:hypothetical protein
MSISRYAVVARLQLATKGYLDQPADQWDVPAVSDGYETTRRRIVDNVERLVAELAGGY